MLLSRGLVLVEVVIGRLWTLRITWNRANISILVGFRCSDLRDKLIESFWNVNVKCRWIVLQRWVWCSEVSQPSIDLTFRWTSHYCWPWEASLRLNDGLLHSCAWRWTWELSFHLVVLFFGCTLWQFFFTELVTVLARLCQTRSKVSLWCRGTIFSLTAEL